MLICFLICHIPPQTLQQFPIHIHFLWPMKQVTTNMGCLKKHIYSHTACRSEVQNQFTRQKSRSQEDALGQ